MADEWEYEYDDNETEDFYVTLDLTSRATLVANKRGTNTRIDVDFLNDPDTHENTPQETTDAAEATTPRDKSAEPDEEDQIQIIGLHEKTPIVAYKGHLYSCRWASSIGTDLFFQRAPEERDEESAPPLRSVGTFDLLGAGSTRLVATPAQLKPRSELVSSQQRSQLVPAHTFVPIETPGTIGGQKFPVSEEATRAQKRQAAFLERLSGVKVRLGEKDKVRATAYTHRGGHHPRNAEDEEDEVGSPHRLPSPTAIQEADEVAPPAPRGTPGRKRGRARRGTTVGRRRRARGSKYDSPLRNEVLGAGAGAESSMERSTPATWAELDRPSPLRRAETVEAEATPTPSHETDGEGRRKSATQDVEMEDVDV